MIILHGDDSLSSRNRLRELKAGFSQKNNSQILSFKAGDLALSELVQLLTGNSLFNDDQLIIIEKLFSGLKNKNKQAIIDFLKNKQPDNLIVWEDKQVDGRKLAAFKVKVENFKIKNSLFAFLDCLSPQRQKEKITLFHQALENSPIELIFFLLARRVAELIVAKDDNGKKLGPMAPWQKNKIIAQAKTFSLKQLIWLYRQLLLIESSQKTGKTKLKLDWQLDLLLSSF